MDEMISLVQYVAQKYGNVEVSNDEAFDLIQDFFE